MHLLVLSIFGFSSFFSLFLDLCWIVRFYSDFLFIYVGFFFHRTGIEKKRLTCEIFSNFSFFVLFYTFLVSFFIQFGKKPQNPTRDIDASISDVGYIFLPNTDPDIQSRPSHQRNGLFLSTDRILSNIYYKYYYIYCSHYYNII